MPEALVVDVDDRVASATAPTVTYNGVALTQAIGAIDPNGGNYVNSYVFYLASTASGFITGSSKNLVVTYPAAPTDSEIEAFTLAGVNLAKMPGTALANSTGTAGTGSTNSITVTTTVTVPGSWVAFDANYRTENATPPAVVAETPTFGTRLTTGNGGSAANGNFWEEEGAGTDIVGAGALIQTSGATGVLSLTESDSAQSNGRETMIGAVFQPQQLTAGSTGALPVTALTLASGATLDLDGNSQTLVSLSDLTPGQGGTIQNSGGAGTLTLSTTGGSTTFSGLITGGISLIMSGSGYQTLAGVNTYTGSTSITGGTLQVGNGATGSLATSGITLSNGGVLNIDSAWTLTTANFISGTGSVVKSGTGALTLEAANSYSLGTTITGGTVAMGTFDGPNENVNALGSGPVSISNNALLSFGGAAGGVVNYSFSNALNVNGGIIFGEDGYNQLGTVTIGAGGLKVDTQWGGKDVAIAQLAGSGPLTIDSAPINNSAPVGIVHVSGSAGYTGTITINPAGVTSLVGTSGVGNGGELEVDSAAALTDASVVMNSTRGMVFNVGNPVFGSLSGSGAMALTSSAAFGTLTVGGVNTNTTYSGVLSGSGGLLKVGSGAMVLGSAETFTGGMTINGGTVQLNAASSFPANTLVTVNAGATLLGNAQDNVYNAGCNLVINDGTYYQASAANRSSLVLVTMTGGTITSGPTSPDALGNICINGTVNATSDAAGNPALINATLVGLNAGAGGSIFNVTRGTGAVDLLITSNIIDTSANPNTPLVKNGSGILALAGSNRYTAGTVLNAGILQLGNIAALGANTGALTVSSSGLLDLHGYNPTVGQLTGAGIINNLALATASTLTVNNDNSTSTFSGSILSTSGAVSLAKAGTGALFLTGTNNYSGTTAVSGGMLQFTQPAALYNGVVGNWTATNISAGSLGTLAVNVDTNGGFSPAQAGTLFANLTGSNSGLLAGSAFGIDTTYATAPVVFSTLLQDSAAGSVGFTKLGPGVLRLTNASNSYSGPTTVLNGELDLGVRIRTPPPDA